MAKNKQQIKFEADVSGFKSAIKESEKQIASLNKELKLNSEQLKGNGKNVDLLQTRLKELKDKYEEQSEIVENTNKALTVAIDTFGENSEEAKKLKNQLTDTETAQEKIKNAINETTVELNKQTSGWIDNGKALQEAGKIVETVGDKIDKLGNKVSVVSAGVGAALVGTSKAAIDYESAFAGVTKTVDATDEQLQALNDGILEMSTRMPAAATEIAGVAESAGQLGIKTDNILSFSEAMIGLGESTNLTAEEAAQQLAKFANIMEMSQDNFDKLGSSIVDLGNNFATTEQDIVNMAMRLAGAGKQVGLSEGQVLGLATALSSVGIEAEMGGSAISKAMVRMQNSVELGGTKLNNILSQTNMSLHDLQLMSTNNTKGFKSLAGSLDMTSTELKNIVNAGVDLENFAKVSGKTTEEFKKQWKDDAAGALSDFIKGLGNAEEQGESAITMLSEMGLTEVRLRDSLLRAANAGNLFNDAIKTGTNAWEENTALTKEVNKRYETTESQIKMLKNEATKLAIEFGRELLPVLKDLLEEAKPLIKNVGEGIKKFSSLDDKTKKTVISIAGFVTIAGPLIKTVGNITTGVGKATSAFGKFSEYIGKSKAEGNSVKGVISAIISPVGVLTIGVTAAAAAWEYLSKKSEEAQKPIKDMIENINQAKQAQDDYNKSIDESTSSELSHVARIQELKQELDLIVDGNGQVKEGYEKRASFILNELNNALGTEYSMNNNIIDSYREISDEIDKLIEKKQADIIMSGLSEKWEKAYNDQQNAIVEQENAYHALEDFAGKMGVSVDTFIDKVRQADKEWDSYGKHAGKHTDLMTEYNKATVEQAKSMIDAYNTATSRVKTNQETIDMYNQKMVYYMDESYDKVVDIVRSATDNYTDYSLQQLKNMIYDEGQQLKDYTHSYETTQADFAQKNKEVSQANLKNLADELVTRTNTIQELSVDEVKAWMALAKNSYEAYARGLAQMPPEVREEIQKATGVVVSDEDLSAAFASLGQDSIEGFNSNDFTQAGKDATSDIQTGVESISLYSSGQTVGGSFAKGLLNKVRSAMAQVNSQQTDGSHADGLAYVPYNGYVARLHEGERVLTKAQNAEYMTNKINNSNMNAVVNIYTQNMTKDNMEQVCRFLERKWGGKS